MKGLDLHNGRKALAALVIGTLISIVAATPAQAAPPPCDVGRLCKWSGTSYTGERMMTYPNAVCTSEGDGYRFRSAYWRGPFSVRVYSGHGCTGSYRTIDGNTGNTNLGFAGRSWKLID